MKLNDRIYKALNISNDSIILDLLRKPGDKKQLHHRAYDEGATQQADLLFLPNDNGYKYALVCVDVATRKIDAQPIKDKKPETVMKAIKKLWGRGVVKEPIVFFKTDDGSEFKGVFNKFLEKSGVIHMIGKAGRSRSQSVVEAVNLMLGKAIATKHRNDELANDEFETEWVDDLPKIIDVYNKYIVEVRPTDKQRKKKMYKDYNISMKEPLLNVGDLVHIPLDKPTNFKGERLNGKFRAGDLKREIKPRKITNVLIGDPTVYKVEGLKNSVYTREMLLLAPNKGKPNSTKDKYEAEKIVKKRKVNGRIEMLVKWKDYDSSDNSWILRSDLMKQIPDLVKQFESK